MTVFAVDKEQALQILRERERERVFLVIHHASRKRRIILSSVACTLCHTRHDIWGKKFFQYEMCVLIFSTALDEAEEEFCKVFS